MNSEISFGAWLRQRRKALDLTQGELADRVGCSVSAIRKIEADERRPSRQVAELLAASLQIPPEEHQTFLKVARAELRVERLSGPHPGSPLPRLQTPPRVPFDVLPPVQEHGSKISSLPGRAQVLPVPPTPLLGREPELAAMSQLLQDPYCRLLTLIGPGGIGKTRLAIEVASQQLDAFADGVYFVSLAPVASPEFMLPTIAGSLDFNFSGSGDPKQQLLDFLREKQLLLVLDNMEHLVEGTGIFSECLQSSPRVKILATSRERLSLQGEWIFEIQGLPFPSEIQSENHVEDYSAVALFMQCARRAVPGFTLADENRENVLHICQLMEGMPLGIELAAAWVRVLSVQEVVQEIERNLDFLATSLRDVPDRHRSLRAAFDHSWKLLSPEEAAVFRQISVFQGGFQRQAAGQVAGAKLPLLSALVDKSLLRRNAADRYDMHMLVRQYASEKLRADPQEQSRVEERYCEYYLDFLQEKETALRGQRDAIESIQAELENVRAAWQMANAAARLDLIGRSAGALAGFYQRTGLLREGEKAIRAALELARQHRSEVGPLGPGTPGLLGKLLANQAGFLNDQGLYFQAAEAAKEALAWSQQDQDAHSEAIAHFRLGQALWRQSELQPALESLQCSLDLAQKNNWPQVEADSLRLTGVVFLDQRDFPEAMRYLEQAMQLSQAIGDRLGESAAFNRLGIAYLDQSDLALAGIYFEKALQSFSEVGDRRGQGRAMNNLGIVSQTLGDYPRARDCFKQGLDIIIEVGDRWGESAFFTNLGLVTLRMGGFREAKRYFEQAILITREIYEWGGEAGSLSNLGLIAYQQGDLEAALQYQKLGLHVAREHKVALIESYIQLRMGRIYAETGKLDQAIEAYGQSLNLRRELKRQYLTIEPLAGLASVYLALGDLATAVEYAGQALGLLDRTEILVAEDADDPCWVLLSIYQVLRTSQDPRARAILESAARLLEKISSFIPTEEQRRSFLEARPLQQRVLDELKKLNQKKVSP
jgi:predicted ATPase/Tfp pilus assembly protein PilF/DNA-binding XRE family transcriptional regulator